jgi:HlyD family secretion protein
VKLVSQGPLEYMTESRRKWLGVVLGTGLLIVVLVALAGRDKPPLVQVVAVTRQDLIASITSNGKVEPITPFTMRAQVAAFVQKVEAVEGQAVKQGQVLVTIDASDVKAQLAQARAELLAAQKQLREAGVGGASAQMVQMEGDVRKAKIEVARLQQQAEVLEQLVELHAATQDELDANQSSLAGSEANLATFEKKLQTSNAELGTDAQAALLRITQAQEQVRALQEKVNSATVTAPVDGTLYSLPVHAGDYLRVGDVVAQMADLRRVKVRAFVDEPDLGWLSPGEEVQVTWEGRPEKSWRGKTEQMPKQVVTRGTRSVGEVLCSVENTQLDLLPNVNVEVQILVREARNALVAPRAVVNSQGRERYVFVLDDDVLRKREVTVGISSATQYQMLSGVKERDKLALSGDLDLKNGMVVRSAEIKAGE